MPDRKLHVIGDGIGAADLELDPNPPVRLGMLKQHVGAWGKSQDPLKILREYSHFGTTRPTDWGLSGEGLLKKGRETHREPSSERPTPP
ncbi:hypothetical protein G3446_25935 [Thiorhodococcus minor]|uniref:Uncharacterized protein n=2 Tax=Thiorhodococcus minor TaxID=57489 RepID=A0A6M0K7A1_9GAMM|nr:hypothetical protein [Thiorhodococcus minor]